MPDLEARIARLFAEELHLEPPRPEVDLLETGLVDSVRLVALFFGLERTFGLRISMEELEFNDFRTVARIARFVAARLTDAPSRTTQAAR